MGKSSITPAWPFYSVLAALLLGLAMPVLYAVGYVFLPWGTNYDTFFTYRIYAAKWQADLFEPAARIEEFVTRRQTIVDYDSP